MHFLFCNHHSLRQPHSLLELVVSSLLWKAGLLWSDQLCCFTDSATFVYCFVLLVCLSWCCLHGMNGLHAVLSVLALALIWPYSAIRRMFCDPYLWTLGYFACHCPIPSCLPCLLELFQKKQPDSTSYQRDPKSIVCSSYRRTQCFVVKSISSLTMATPGEVTKSTYAVVELLLQVVFLGFCQWHWPSWWWQWKGIE